MKQLSMTENANLNFPTGPVCSSVSQRNKSKERCKENRHKRLHRHLFINKHCGDILDTRTQTCHGINIPFHSLHVTYPSMVSYLSQ